MNKNLKNNLPISLKELMGHVTLDIYTRQTLTSLFRCFVETIIENKYDAVILVKTKGSQDLQGIINRLLYSEAKVYIYSDHPEKDKANHILLNQPELENDEFLIIITERISVCLYWNESISESFELCQGFLTLNPFETRQITDHLQSIAFNESLQKDLLGIKQDRRHNEIFTSALRKLTTSLENHNRDLICVSTELKELHDKTLHSEKLAAIGQLCSTIAHELRNPLGMINLYAKIISKKIEEIGEVKNDEVVDSLIRAADSISNASLNLEKLLTELLDYSKPMNIVKDEENLKQALTEIIDLVRPSFEDKEVKLDLFYKLSSSTKVKFDKSRLEQVVLNVIKNALEVSKSKDKVEIFVEYNSFDGQIYIKVKDQGQGISAENLGKIFTPYFTTKKEGTGLGLARAQKIMEAHGGNLIVVSTSSKGTIFGITLPVENSHYEYDTGIIS